MGLFDTILSFFKSNPAEPSKSSEQISKNDRKPIEQSKPAAWLINEAFDKVMASVEVTENLKRQFYEDFSKAHQAGSPREEEEAAIKAFLNSAWIWHEYDKWEIEFKKRGIYPVMWDICGLTLLPPTDPTTIEDALKYLTVAKMRELLKINGIQRKPAPKKREEFEAVIKEELVFDSILTTIRESVEAHRRYFYEKIDAGKCKLLSHTLSMTIYSSLRFHQGSAVVNSGFRKYKIKVISSAGCSIEDEFRDKFNSGEISTIPPCFPGDRNSLICERQER